GQGLLKLGEPADLDLVASAAADPNPGLRMIVGEAMLQMAPAASFVHFSAIKDPVVRFQVASMFISRHRYATKSALDSQWLEAGLADAALWQATPLPSLKEATANALVVAVERAARPLDLDRALRLWAALAGTRIWRQRVSSLLIQACFPDLQVPGDPDLLATL